VLVRAAQLIALAATVVGFIGGCGYGFTAGDKPFGSSRLAVMTFAEWEPLGISPEITRYFSEIAAHEGADIVFDSANADERLEGVVRQGRTNALPIADPQAAIAGYQIIVDVDARLVDRAGTVLWASTLTFSEDFLPGPATVGPQQATLGTEASRRRALDRVAQRAAREIYDRIVVSSALEVKTAPLQPGKNVPRMSPWAPLPPLTPAGAPIYGAQPQLNPGESPPPAQAVQQTPSQTTQLQPPSGTFAPTQSPTVVPATRVPPPQPTEDPASPENLASPEAPAPPEGTSNASPK
jgi:hypothetical protein